MRQKLAVTLQPDYCFIMSSHNQQRDSGFSPRPSLKRLMNLTYFGQVPGSTESGDGYRKPLHSVTGTPRRTGAHPDEPHRPRHPDLLSCESNETGAHEPRSHSDRVSKETLS